MENEFNVEKFIIDEYKVLNNRTLNAILDRQNEILTDIDNLSNEIDDVKDSLNTIMKLCRITGFILGIIIVLILTH